MPCGAAWRARGLQRSSNSGSWLEPRRKPKSPEEPMSGMFKRSLLPAAFMWLAPLALLPQGWQHLGDVQKVEKLPDGLELTSGKAKVRLTVFREGVFRVRVAPNGTFPKDFSWAVVETALAPAVRVDDSKDEVRLTAGNIVARIRKSPPLIDFLRDTGEVLVADGPGRPMGLHDGPGPGLERLPWEESNDGP